MANFDRNGRNVEYEIESMETEDGNLVDNWEEGEKEYDPVVTVVYWYELEGAAGREYGTVHGPWAGEADIESQIEDSIEGSP